MIERFVYGKVTWVMMKNPSSDEIKKVMVEHDISPLLMNDLTTPIPKNYATKVDTAIKIVLDFPVIKKISTEHPYEVKFIISKKSLITVQYEEMGGMDRFKRQAEVAVTLRKKQHETTGAHLFFSLITQLYESTALKLDYLETKLNDIESQIFQENEKEMVFEISMVSKKLIAFKHILNAQQDIFADALPHFQSLFKNHFDTNMTAIRKQYNTLNMHTDTLFQTLMALRDTNTALLSTKQNEVMKLFSIMAFVTYPLTLISSIFGMNTEFTPLVGHPFDFWIVMGIMFTAMVFFFTYFKHKHWL